jgi:hypothetical protein
VLSVDDSVLDKPYSQYLAFVGYFWSGKHHRTVKGINLITLYYTDVHDQHLPINFRVYDKSEGKTKNDYFQDMLDEVLAWGLEPAMVTGDSWYSGVDNLKRIRNHQLGWLFALEKDQPRHYAVFLANEEQLAACDRKTFTDQHDKHWHIEQYHRAIKQVCNIEHFQVRSKVAIKNHFFASICGYVQLQKLSAMSLINNCYSIQRNLFNEVIAAFIGTFMPTMAHLNPEFQSVVNA